VKIDRRLTPKSFEKALERFFELSGKKIHALNTAWDPAAGSPVFTLQGK